MKKTIAILLVLAMALSMMPLVSAFAADTVTLYLNPSSGWKNDGARFALYWFKGSDNGWVSMESAGDGYYKANAPVDMTYIFCRMNPATSENNWDNKWNQTGNLPAPTGDNNCFAVPDGTWDGATGDWTTYAPPVFVIAGDEALTGENWNAVSTAKNTMAKQSDGTYSITFQNVAVNECYKFKVTNGFDWEDPKHQSFTAQDVTIRVAQKGDVIINYNPETGAFTYTGAAPTLDLTKGIFVAGNGSGNWLHGKDWGNTWADDGDVNKMTADGKKFSITYEDVAAGSYQFKFTVGKAWNDEFGGAFSAFGTASGAVHKGGNIEFTTDALSDIRIELDLTNYNHADNSGATFTVSATPVKYFATLDDGSKVEMTQADGVFSASFSNNAAKNGYSVKVFKNEETTPVYTGSVDVTKGGSTIIVSYSADGGSAVAQEYTYTVTMGTGDPCEMTFANGKYTYTYSSVAAGELSFVIKKDGTEAGTKSATADATSMVVVTYDPAANETSVKVIPLASYYVAGVKELCGSEWNEKDAKNLMTVNTNGTYTITYKDLVPNTRYAFKITDGTWGKSWPAQDKEFAVAAKGDVTITFDPATGAVTLSKNAIKYVPVISDTDKLVVAGSADLCGSEWSATDEKNLLVKGDDGSYSITYKNVAKGDYELKVVLNGSTWIGGVDGNNVKITVNAACDVTVSYTAAGGIKVTGANVTVHVPEVPTSGDSTQLFGLVIVMTVAVLGLGVTILSKKKFC